MSAKQKKITGKKRKNDNKDSKNEGPDKKKPKQDATTVTSAHKWPIKKIFAAITSPTTTNPKMSFKRAGRLIEVFLEDDTPLTLQVGGPSNPLSTSCGWSDMYINERGICSWLASLNPDFNPVEYAVFQWFDEELGKWAFKEQAKDPSFIKGLGYSENAKEFQIGHVRKSVQKKPYKDKESNAPKIAYNFKPKIFTKNCVLNGYDTPPTRIVDFNETAKSTKDCKPLDLNAFKNYSYRPNKPTDGFTGAHCFFSVIIRHVSVSGLGDESKLGYVITTPIITIVSNDLKKKLTGELYDYEKELKTAIKFKPAEITFESKKI